jgi:hypothetical protein
LILVFSSAKNGKSYLEKLSYGVKLQQVYRVYLMEAFYLPASEQ